MCGDFCLSDDEAARSAEFKEQLNDLLEEYRCLENALVAAHAPPMWQVGDLASESESGTLPH